MPGLQSYVQNVSVLECSKPLSTAGVGFIESGAFGEFAWDELIMYTMLMGTRKRGRRKSEKIKSHKYTAMIFIFRQTV